MAKEAPADSVEPTPVAAPVKKGGASRIVTPILALVAALALGLFGGILIGQNTANANANPAARAGFGANGFRGGFGQAGGNGGTSAPGGGFGGFTTGTIVSVSGTTITLKEANGTTVTVDTTATTNVTKTTKAALTDLVAGDQIRVIGTTSGTTVTATTIADGDVGFGGFRPGGAGGAGEAGGGNN